jgi:hypothetical protein
MDSGKTRAVPGLAGSSQRNTHRIEKKEKESNYAAKDWADAISWCRPWAPSFGHDAEQEPGGGKSVFLSCITGSLAASIGNKRNANSRWPTSWCP